MPKKPAWPSAHLSGEAHQQIEADHGEREDEDQRGDAQIKERRQQQRQQRDDERDQHHHDRVGAREKPAHRLHALHAGAAEQALRHHEQHAAG